MDNGFIVPYNYKLLLMFGAYINVEWCNQSKAIKYHFKYISKGLDITTMAIEDNVKADKITNKQEIKIVDEITMYVDTYISACEAAWRIYQFDICFRTVGVTRLQLHLSEQQPVTLSDTTNLQRGN